MAWRGEASCPKQHRRLAVATEIARAQPDRSLERLNISGGRWATTGSSARRRTHRVFKSYDDILDPCCFAGNKRIAMPCKTMSIGSRDEAHRS